MRGFGRSLRWLAPTHPSGTNRHITVYGALNLASGRWFYQLGRRRAAEFVAFLQVLAGAYPRAPKIVVICDNDSIHHAKAVTAYLAGQLEPAAAFEATLLGMVIAHEDALRANGMWPIGASYMHLTELARLAGERGWLTGEAGWGVVEVLNKARTMAAHPGAYVRGMRSASAELDLRDSDGYRTCLEIVVKATGQLSSAHDAILRTAGT
jgi:hypothetical protein